MNLTCVLLMLVVVALVPGCGVKGNLVAYVDAETRADTTKDLDRKVNTAPSASDQSNTKAACSNDATCPSMKEQKTP